MKISITTKPLNAQSAAAVLIFKDHIKTNEALKKFQPEIRTLVQAVIGECDFQAEPDQCISVPTTGTPRLVILMGCADKTRFTLESLRMAVATTIKHANNLAVNDLSFSINLPEVDIDKSDIVRTITETAHMTTYRYDKYKTERKVYKISSVTIADASETETKKLATALEIGNTLGELNIATRDLVNTPPDVCTPEYFADMAVKMGKDYGFTVKVMAPKELKTLGMEGILHVGAGGEHPPRLVVAEYKGGKGKKIAFVGKGVCFDSGGLDIKPAAAMDTMKMDKAGASAVLNAIAGCARLKLKGTFLGIMPLVENMPGNAAYKPGDIIVTRSKKTIEVLNTDAEGRVILSDALFYATEQKPDYMIDLATLTGACIIALGPGVAGLMSNSDEVAKKVKEAASKTNEKVWELPMYDEFMDMIKSEYADVKNVVSNQPGNGAGAITAAKFLELFVNKVPWSHIDIAGPAWCSMEKGYHSTGGTGFGTRLLLEIAIKESG